MGNKERDVKFASSEIGGLKDDLAQMQQQNKIRDERNDALQSQVDALEQGQKRQLTHIIWQIRYSGHNAKH